MKKKIVALLVCCIFLGVVLTACGGGGAKVETQSNVSLGQELTDLDKAYKDGVITEKEYEKVKKEILKKYK